MEQLLLAARPPLRVLALAQHFGLHRVTILHSRDVLNDDKWDALAELCNELNAGAIHYYHYYYCSTMDISEDEPPLLLSPGYLRQSLVVDLDGGGHQRIATREEYFTFDIYWLVPSGQDSEPPLGLRLDSNFYALIVNGSSAPPQIVEWYRIRSKLVVIHTFGSWSGGKLKVDVPSVWERRRDLKGITLTTVTDPWSTIVINRGGGSFDGFIPDIVDALGRASNFSVSWQVQEDRVYGSRDPNGTWTGMVGKVWSEEADLVAAFLAVTIARSEACSYTTAFAESLGTLMIVDTAYVKRQNVLNLLAFLHVFTLEGWILTLVSLVAVGLTCFVLLALEDDSAAEHTLRMKDRLAMCCGFVFGSVILQESVTLRPNLLSKKILTITAGYFSIVSMAYYEGMLTSFMTTQSSTVYFREFADVLSLGYQVIVNEGTKHVTDLETALPGTGRHKVYHETMRGNPEAFCPTAKTCIDALLSTPNLAYVGSSYNAMGNERFVVFKKLSDATMDHVAFALQRDSELLRLFNHNLMRLKTNGLVDKFHRKWVDGDRPENVCGDRRAEQAFPLGYENLFMPSLLLMGGVTLALGLTLLEASAWRVAKRGTSHG